MAYRSLVKNLVTSAFSIIDDLRDTAVFTRKIPTVYNPITDSMGYTTTVVTVKGVFARFSAHEVTDRIVTLTDAKFLFPASAMTFVPSVNDTLSIKGKIWDVVEIMAPPADALIILHIRVR